MAELRRLLILSNSINVDILPYSLFGWAFEGLTSYWERWSQPLLDREKTVGAFVSIPYEYMEKPGLQAAWEKEKASLNQTFQNMAKLGLEIDGLHDLTALPAAEAREKVRELLLEHRQVIGIAHVPETYRDIPLCVCHDELEGLAKESDLPTDVSFVLRDRDGGFEQVMGRLSLGSGNVHFGKLQKFLMGHELILRLKLDSPPYFEVGMNGKLDEQFFKKTAKDIRSTPEELKGRAIFLGCKTVQTGLARSLVRSGLAIVEIGTPRAVSLHKALALLRAVLVAGYQPANQALKPIAGIASKLIGFPRPGPPSFFLVLKSSVDFPNGEKAFYWGYYNGSELPVLEPITKEEVIERLQTLIPFNTWAVVDVPPEIREEVSAAVRTRPVLWPAFGASCASVNKLLLESPGYEVVYELGYVDKASPGIVFNLVLDYPCMSIQNINQPLLINSMLFEREMKHYQVFHLLTQLTRAGATLVVAVVEKGFIE